MQIELVANLIEAMDFATFRDFVRETLLQRGYSAIPSDGWSDGGRDIAVYKLDGRVARQLAFQTSVERDWGAKLWEDLVKAKHKLGCTDFVYVTNRRIGDAVFDPYVHRAITEEEVHLSKFDKQALAAHVVDTDRTAWFATYVGLRNAESPSTVASLRKEVADAFVLFSDDAEDFRDRIAEHAVMVALLRRGQMTRKQLIAEAIAILDYADEDRFNAAIDRLQQNGEIRNRRTKFELKPKTKEQYLATQTLVNADREEYRQALENCLEEYLSVPTSELRAAVSAVEELLGAIVRRYSDYQVSLLQDSHQANDIRQEYAQEVRSLESSLHTIGIPPDSVKNCIDRINSIANEHPVVTRLAAGDVFRRLVPSGQSSLLNALGRVQAVKAYLEPTVAIPLLCSKLYKNASGNRNLRSAQWLFDRAAALRVKFYVPDIYVEECAVHLLAAGQYVNVFQRVDSQELSYSENAFVAFYAALCADHGPMPSYKEFLEAFGFVAGGDVRDRKEQVQIKLRQLLRTYKIQIEDVRAYRPKQKIQRAAEQDLSYIYQQCGIDKPSVLVRHDTQMLAFARDQANQGDEAILLTTWDNSLQSACRMDGYNWWCMDPLHAGDLMALVEPGRRGAMGVDVALLLDDARLQNASKVWDTLVRIEKDKMYDAELIGKATKFRNDFMKRQNADAVATDSIVKEWKKWQSSGLQWV